MTSKKTSKKAKRGKVAKGLVAKARAFVAKHVERVQDRAFVDAAMAASALVALADEEVSLAEQVALDHVLENATRLEKFDAHEAVRMNRLWIEAIRANRQSGRRAALETVSHYKDDPAEAELLLAVGLAIAKADSEVSEIENKALGEICKALGLERDTAFTWSLDS